MFLSWKHPNAEFLEVFATYKPFFSQKPLFWLLFLQIHIQNNLLVLFKRINLLIMYICIYLYICFYTCMQCSWWSKESVRSPELKFQVTGASVRMYWGLNLDLLKEHQVINYQTIPSAPICCFWFKPNFSTLFLNFRVIRQVYFLINCVCYRSGGVVLWWTLLWLVILEEIR